MSVFLDRVEIFLFLILVSIIISVIFKNSHFSPCGHFAMSDISIIQRAARRRPNPRQKLVTIERNIPIFRFSTWQFYRLNTREKEHRTANFQHSYTLIKHFMVFIKYFIVVVLAGFSTVFLRLNGKCSKCKYMLPILCKKIEKLFLASCYLKLSLLSTLPGAPCGVCNKDSWLYILGVIGS